MTPERWGEIKSALDMVLAEAAATRGELLGRITKDDPELRLEVESLLTFEEDASKLDTRLFPGAAVLLDVAKAPEWIGPYQIRREIGRGGMGVVYLGERADGQYEKRVAIKLITAGFCDPDLNRRFQRERQILAQLDHPNIARLLDGGLISEGQPYFVMEYVEGLPLIEHCDAKRLMPEARLALFLDVCQAVAHAHNRLIVHRDLKPGNILVADSGPKLLDFGLARVLSPGDSDAGLLTAALMTPAYASPEQVRGELLTVASDVYSLGVILYELLAGRRPHRDTGSAVDTARAICDDEPIPLSRAMVVVETAASRSSTPQKLRKVLSGDLEIIVGKALARDPVARYSTVEALAADIKRYLGGRPIQARPATFAYRAAKLVRRHRWAFAAGGIGLSLILAFAVTAWWEARQAQRRFNDVRQLAHSVVFDLHDAIAKLPGSTAARELLIREALVYLEKLSQESGNDPALLLELSRGYMKIGDVLGNRSQSNLGRFDAAADSYRKANAIVARLSARYPDDVVIQRERVRAITRLAEQAATAGDLTNSLRMVREGVALAERVSEDRRNDMDALWELASSLYSLADILTTRTQYEEALAVRGRLLELYQRIAAARGETTANLHAMALVRKKTGALYGVLKRYPECQEQYEIARGIDEKLLARDKSNIGARLDLSYDYSDLGWVMGRTGNLTEALAAHRKALELRQSAADADPDDFRAAVSVASSTSRIGTALFRLGKQREGIASTEEAIAKYRVLVNRKGEDPATQLSLASAYMDLGDEYQAVRECGKAVSAYEGAQVLMVHVKDRTGLSASNTRELVELGNKIEACRKK